MFRSVAFIVNPIAGRTKAGAVVADVARRLSRIGATVRILRTSQPGHAVALSRELPDDVEAVVAVGGDGTAREVTEGRIGRPLPIILLPAGTENLLARHLGFTATSECVWSCVQSGRVRPFDVGTASGRHFLCVSGVGFDAEVVQRVTRRRRGHITRADYLWPTWRTFWEYRFAPIRVSVDGRVCFEGPGLVIVGNIPLYGMGLRILRDARDDDGLLDVCVYPCRWQAELLRHSVNTLLRRHVEQRDVVYTLARDVLVESSDSLALEADGDCAGTLPARMGILPGQALFCVPP